MVINRPQICVQSTTYYIISLRVDFFKNHHHASQERETQENSHALLTELCPCPCPKARPISEANKRPSSVDSRMRNRNISAKDLSLDSDGGGLSSRNQARVSRWENLELEREREGKKQDDIIYRIIYYLLLTKVQNRPHACAKLSTRIFDRSEVFKIFSLLPENLPGADLLSLLTYRRLIVDW